MGLRMKRPAGDFIQRAVLGFSIMSFAVSGLLISFIPVALPFLATASFTAAWILLAKTDLWRGAFRDFSGTHLAAALLAGCASARYAIVGPYEQYGPVWRMMFSMSGILAAPAMYLLFYAVYKIFRHLVLRFLSGTSRMSRNEAAGFLVTALFFAAVMFAAFSKSDMFYRSDSVYTFDSVIVLDHDAFFYPSASDNDIRSIFFGIVAMPFATPCHLISDVFSVFVGTDIYPHLIGAIQCLAMAFSIMLFSRMTSKDPYVRAAAWLLAAASYMCVLNSVAVEQYAFAVFWLAMFLYLYLEDGLGFEADVCCVAACGCMMTTLFLLLPVFLREKKIAWKHAGKCVAWAAGILVLSGQAVWVLYAIAQGHMYSRFFGGTGVLERFWSFSELVRASFLAPHAHGVFQGFPIDDLPGPWASWQTDCVSGPDLVGFAIIVIMAAGFWMARHDRFAGLCGWWALSSVFITCALGWGLSEGGLVIYNLYFGWAYLCLVVKFLEYLFHGRGIAILCAGVFFSAAMLTYNAAAMRDMTAFIARYPNIRHDPTMVHLWLGRCCSGS